MTLKIAFSGAGYIINIHAQAAKVQNDIALVAVAEKFSNKSEPFIRKFSIKHSYGTVEEMLKSGSVDALVVGTPNYLHAPQAIAALNAGVHVMVEKPMAMNIAEAEKMIEASQKSGAKLMVAHCWRFDADVLWLKKQAAQIGQVIRTKSIGVHINWGPGGWFTQKKYAGGGALVDMGIHALDTTRFLLGDPKPTSVFAKIGTYYGDFDVDDTGVIFAIWENGVVSYIESGWWQPYADGPDAATQLYGEKGFASLFPTRLLLPDTKTKSVAETACPFPYPREEHCPQSMYDAQMAHFIDCIRNDKTPRPGGNEGLVNMKIIEAAYESARTARLVEVTP
jgi:predicted dehydrogenase